MRSFAWLQDFVVHIFGGDGAWEQSPTHNQMNAFTADELTQSGDHSWIDKISLRIFRETRVRSIVI